MNRSVLSEDDYRSYARISESYLLSHRPNWTHRICDLVLVKKSEQFVYSLLLRTTHLLLDGQIRFPTPAYFWDSDE